MKIQFGILSSLAVLFAFPLQLQPAFAQPDRPCSNEEQTQPAETTRAIANAEFGLRFNIPSNYRTRLERQGDRLLILVRNPADVEFLECASQHRVIGAGHQVSDAIVSVEPLSPDMKNVRDLIRGTDSDWIEIVSQEITEIASQEAVIYTRQAGDPYRLRTAALIHPDGRHLVEIYVGDYGRSIESVDLQVFEAIVSSLEIDRSR
jgi:hypothetical protein